MRGRKAQEKEKTLYKKRRQKDNVGRGTKHKINKISNK